MSSFETAPHHETTKENPFLASTGVYHRIYFLEEHNRWQLITYVFRPSSQRTLSVSIVAVVRTRSTRGSSRSLISVVLNPGQNLTARRVTFAIALSVAIIQIPGKGSSSKRIRRGSRLTAGSSSKSLNYLVRIILISRSSSS
jgi:hypothetical protein